MNWLSVHLHFSGSIYGTECDALVIDTVRPVISWALDSGLASKAFFIRYNDGGPHVRLRILPADADAMVVLKQNALGSVGVATMAHASRTQIRRQEEVPYVAEDGRYGGPFAVGVAERLFTTSTLCVIEELRKADPMPKPRRLGKGLVSMIVTVYDLLGGERGLRRFAHWYASSYLNVTRPDPTQRSEALQQFQKGTMSQRKCLAEIVDDALAAVANGHLPTNLEAYSDSIESIWAEYQAIYAAGQLTIYADSCATWEDAALKLCASFVHMHNNRLGISIHEESYLAFVLADALNERAA